MKKALLVLALIFSICAAALAAGEHFWIQGFKYYSLADICGDNAIDYEWDPVGRTITLSKNAIEVKLRLGSDKALIDGEKIRDIGPPVYAYEDAIAIPAAFATSLGREIFKVKENKKTSARKKAAREYVPQARGIKTVVIDPGHGGKDPGAISPRRKMHEKDINLDMAKRLKAELTNLGIKVYLTREKDVFIPLEDRAAFANEKKADLFICMHANSSTNKDLAGFEIYYLSKKNANDSERALKAAKDTSMSYGGGSFAKNDTTTKAIVYDLILTDSWIDSKRLAELLLYSARRKGISTRWNSLKDANFHVLRNFKTDMPAVLVEIGYISNRKEEELIADSAYRQKVAEAVANGIMSYKKESDRQTGGGR